MSCKQVGRTLAELGLYFMDPDDRMLANTWTPDGYWVDANGVWIN